MKRLDRWSPKPTIRLRIQFKIFTCLLWVIVCYSSLPCAWGASAGNEKKTLTVTLGINPIYIEPTGGTYTCSAQNGFTCPPNQVCKGNWLPASDTDMCCSEGCKPSKETTFGFVSTLNNPLSPEIVSYYKDLGIAAIRYPVVNRIWIENAKGSYNFRATDANILAQQAAGYPVDYTFLSQENRWDFACYEDPNDHRYNPNCVKVSPTGRKKTKCYPCNEQAYVDYIKSALKRYDGDCDYDDSSSCSDNPDIGEDGRTALPKVIYWEVENEPHGVFWQDTAKNYARLLKLAYQTIKQNCPDCQVLCAGIGGGASFSSGFPHPADTFNDAVFRYLKGDDYCATHNYCFDVISIHHYGYAAVPASKVNYTRGVKRYGYRQLADKLANIYSKYGFSKPVWVNETATYSGDPKDIGQPNLPQSEQLQAVDLVKRFVFFLSIPCVERVFWYEIKELDSGRDGYHDHVGLVYNGRGSRDRGNGVKKLAYYSMKLLRAKLMGRSSNHPEIIRQFDNVYVYKFTKSGKPIYIAWWDWFEESGNAKTVTLTLPDIRTKQVKVTEAIPNAQSGADLDPRSYPSFFNVKTVSLNETISLQN